MLLCNSRSNVAASSSEISSLKGKSALTKILLSLIAVWKIVSGVKHLVSCATEKLQVVGVNRIRVLVVMEHNVNHNGVGADVGRVGLFNHNA